MSNDTQQLDYERIRILYAAMNRIFVGGFLLTLFLAFIIKEHMATNLVLIWFCSTVSLYIPRLYTTRLFNKKIENNQITPANVLKWETVWILTTVPLLAAFTSLLYYPIGNEQLDIVATFLVILASGSILSYATSFKSIIASFCVIYIPLIIRYLIAGDQHFFIYSLFYALVTIVFSSYAMSLHRTLIENIQLKIDNESHALKDPLTRLWNRRGLYLHLNTILPHAIRNNEPLGVIIMDVDRFKEYNDTYGHNAGDDALINVATCIEKEGRKEDLIVRYGGEEFLAVIPNADINKLTNITERIFHAIRNNTNVTVSAGLAAHTAEINFDQLINMADEALYAAKAAGRNQYKIASKT